MSASLRYMCGDTTKMSKLAEENAGVTEARFLFSTSKYTLAITNCLDILSQLGQTFPSQPNLNEIQAELLHIQPLLLGLTFDQMKALPPMTDKKKLQAMKILSLMCTVSDMGDPMLLPLLSTRMIRLTLKFGFCHESVIGMVTTAFSVVS